MSEKRQVPTFQVHLLTSEDALQGPIVNPLRTSAAVSLTDVHHILHEHGALLVYAKKWIYVPFHAIYTIEKGKQRFDLPWPLTNDNGAETDDKPA